VRAYRHGRMIKDLAAQGYQRTYGAGSFDCAQDRLFDLRYAQDDGISWLRILKRSLQLSVSAASGVERIEGGLSESMGKMNRSGE